MTLLLSKRLSNLLGLVLNFLILVSRNAAGGSKMTISSTVGALTTLKMRWVMAVTPVAQRCIAKIRLLGWRLCGLVGRCLVKLGSDSKVLGSLTLP